MSLVGDIVGGIVSPITGLLAKKEERKQAHQAAQSALTAAQESNEHEVVINEQHLETVLADKTSTTWRDEYVTVSLICIINAVVGGGILQGFGYPEFLQGVLIGVQTLDQVVDLRWAMNAAVASSLGFSIWRKI